MPPPMQRFTGALTNVGSHYQGYPTHPQTHNTGLPPPALGANPTFMNPNSMNNAFSVNGNPLSLSGGFGGTAALGMPGATGLASHAAQMGFAGASPQQHHNGMGERAPVNKGRVREVWQSNLHQEFHTLRQLVDRYPYVAMDTQVPGAIARPMGSFNGKADYHYQCVRCNVDLIKIIQLGITLFNEEGETPPSLQGESEMNGRRNRSRAAQDPLPHTWQFNFKFSTDNDMYSEGGMDSLKQAGVNFATHERDGVDPFEFGALLITSGLVCDEDVKWISFHGGYDFAYTTKLLRRLPLPDDEAEFEKDMKKFFPSIIDVKYLMKYAISNNTTNVLDPQVADVLMKFHEKPLLDTLSECFKIKRQGPPNQAGSESLLTGKVFFRIRDRIFNGEIGEEHLGQVWGLNLPEFQLAPRDIPSYHQQQPQPEQSHTPQQNGYSNGGPSTPNTGNARLVHTPSNNNNSGSRIQPMTPGGGGGVFGAFDLSRQ